MYQVLKIVEFDFKLRDDLRIFALKINKKYMKIIRISISVLLVLFFAFTVQAQDKKVEFGIMAGYGHTMPRLKDSRIEKSPMINEYNLNGFHAGPIVVFNVGEQASIQTGILYNYFRGIQNDRAALKNVFGVWEQSKTIYSAIDLPLRLMYSVTLADEFSFFMFAGPNLNYSINKVTSTEYYVSNKLNKEDSQSNIYKAPSDYRAMDLQMGAGLGVQYYGVLLRAGYDWGILNRTKLDDATLRANDIKVSLGYTF